MSSVLRTIEFLALSLWLGGDVFLSFVVAPGAFHLLASRDAAGAIVAYSLTRMHLGGITLGILFLLVRLARTRNGAILVSPAAFCVELMLLLTVVSQLAISPKMASLRLRMGSIQATAASSPLLEQFGKLHLLSVLLESGVLLAAMTAMYFMVRELAEGG